MPQPLLDSVDQDEYVVYPERADAEEDLMSLAPVEESSPLGYNVGLLNATLLNTSAMVKLICISLSPDISKSYNRSAWEYTRLLALSSNPLGLWAC